MSKAMRKKIAHLESDNNSLRQDLKFSREVRENMELQIEAYKQAWRRVHPEDQAFMREFEAKNDNPVLFDIFNRLLYGFGRPGSDDRIFTRLDSWNK